MADVSPHVLVSGLCMAIPLPFVDDYLSRKALRRALAVDAEAAGSPLDDAALDALTDDRANLLVGCLRAALLWPVKKLFRTVFFVFTIKDVIDVATRSAEVVAMVRIARAQGWLPARARDVRDALEVSFGRHRWSPVTRFLMRYERPELPEPAADDALGRLLQGLRRHAGAAPMEAMFVDRVRTTVEADRPAALAGPAEVSAPG